VTIASPGDETARQILLCRSCGQDNREGAGFCRNCGGGLGPACPSCGAVVGPGASFCDACGGPLATGSPADAPEPRSYTPERLAEKILAARGSLEGEHKQVTVLFADVKGSMDLSEPMDTEVWHGITQQFFALLCEGVHRFEGTVTQFTGDGIMALFGAPIAHEDHTRRACYTALHLGETLAAYAAELRRSRGLNFSVRMGINSGEVVVGSIGEDLRVDYTAIGHTVGLAKRMEQLAEPGKAYLTEYAAALASGYFQLGDLGEFEIKGVGQPLQVYELQGVGELRTRLDMSRMRGFTRFVGRQDEMATLESALAHALEGRGQVVGVVGEAGLGKSRLCYEFAQKCRARDVTVRETHGVAHGKAIPFLPVLEFLRGFFGITERDADETAREKIAGRLLLLDTALDEALPLVFDFMGVPDPERPAAAMEPEARQRQLFAVFKRGMQARSEREPAVLLFEDLHWFDGGSEAFVESWVDAVPSTRTLLLLNFRPEYHAPWMQKSYYQQLPLLPLGPEAVEELIQDLLGSDASLGDLGNRIRERTGGNPFFVEEVVLALVESGSLKGSKGGYRLVRPAEEEALPATVQALLAARIDRLGEREKSVLQAASVIGKEFAEPVLRRVVELPEGQLTPALDALTSAEFLYEQALYPEAEYAFKHPLTQEVAYGSQLSERRARVHRAVAEATAELYPERLDELSGLLAHHWEQAGEALEAARWSRRAAEWAGRSDIAQALRHWRKVRELLDQAPESPEAMSLGLLARARIIPVGYRLGITDEEVSTLVAEGRALAERSGDLRGLAMLVGFSGQARLFAGKVSEALEPGLEAARLAEQLDDADLKLLTKIVLINTLGFLGQLGEALRHAEDAEGLARGNVEAGYRILGRSGYVILLWIKAAVLSDMGRLAEATHDLDRALELAGERGEVENGGWAHSVYSLAGYNLDAQSALRHARQALEIADRLGNTALSVLALLGLGGAYLLQEEWSEAATTLQQGLAIARERRTGLLWEPGILAYLAEAYAGQGKAAQALAAAKEALAVAQRQGNRRFEVPAHLALARVLLRSEGAKAKGGIEAALARALAMVEESGARVHEPFIRVELAELARLTGDAEAHRRELREAHRLFAEMGAAGHAARLAPELQG